MKNSKNIRIPGGRIAAGIITAPTETDSRGREQSTRDTQEGKYQDSSSGNSNKQKWGDLPKE